MYHNLDTPPPYVWHNSPAPTNSYSMNHTAMASTTTTGLQTMTNSVLAYRNNVNNVPSMLTATPMVTVPAGPVNMPFSQMGYLPGYTQPSSVQSRLPTPITMAVPA